MRWREPHGASVLPLGRHAPWVVALAVLALFLTGCVGGEDSDGGTPSPRPPLTVTSSPSPTGSTATATGPSPSPTPEPTEPAVGVPRAITFGPTEVRWERYEPPTGEGEADEDAALRQLVYDVDADALWTLSGPDGDPYRLSWSPHDDLAIATRWDAGQASGSDSVLLDPRAGTVRRLLPFPIAVADWPEPDRVLVRVGIVLGGRDGPEGWTRGLYEFDLGAETITLIQAGDAYGGLHPQPVLVPDGSALTPGSRIERRVFPDEGWSALVQVLPNGEESVIRDHLGEIVWSPDEQRVALVGTDNVLVLFDVSTGDLRSLGMPSYWGRPVWSPDGRYLAAIAGTEVVIFDLASLPGLVPDAPVPALGPYEATAFADWGPGETTTEALLLGEYCEPDGFRLDRLDLASGARRRIPTESAGFWVYDWSPRGDLIAVSSWEIGFALIDAESGNLRGGAELAAAVTTMQDVAWSASGEWLAMNNIGGRDRCSV